MLGVAFSALTLLVNVGVWLLEACFNYLQKFNYGHGSHASWISFLKFPGPEKSWKISLVWKVLEIKVCVPRKYWSLITVLFITCICLSLGSFLYCLTL